MIRNRFTAYALTLITFLYVFRDCEMDRFGAFMLITWIYIGFLALTVWVEEKYLKRKKRRQIRKEKAA